MNSSKVSTLILLLVLLLPLLLAAQEKVKIKEMEEYSSNGSVKRVFGYRKDHPIMKNPSEKKFFIANSKEGKYELYFLDKLITAGQYDDSFLEGKWQFYDYSGNLYFEGNYNYNQQDSVWDYYYRDKLMTKEFHNGGEADSLYGYYQNGTISFKKYKTGLYNQLARTYTEEGILLEEMEFENYYLLRNYKLYFKNGQLHKDVVFQNEKPFSIVSCFNENGNPMDCGNLQEGNGNYKIYNINDSLKIHAEISFRDSLLHGEPKIYDTNGTIEKKFYFYNGVPLNASKFEKWESENWQENFNFGNAPQKNILFSIPASFQGGNIALEKYLYETITNNPKIKEEGEIKLTILILRTGQVVLYTSEPLLEENSQKEIFNAIREMPRWNPRFKYGVPMRTLYNITVDLR